MSSSTWMRIACTGLALALGGAASAHPPARGSSAGLQVRLGVFEPAGGDEFWNETEEAFTLDTEDLRDLAWGVTFVTALTDRIELGFNLDRAEGSALSEYRECFHDPCEAVFHDTRLETVPLTADVRLLFGRRSTRHPRPILFVGAGGGVNLWSYEEVGEFIEFDGQPDPPIFFGRFEDSGAALTLHALAGIELPLGRTTNLTFEGRYAWSDDRLEEDFAGLGSIELGGASVFGGLSFRF